MHAKQLSYLRRNGVKPGAGLLCAHEVNCQLPVGVSRGARYSLAVISIPITLTLVPPRTEGYDAIRDTPRMSIVSLPCCCPRVR